MEDNDKIADSPQGGNGRKESHVPLGVQGAPPGEDKLMAYLDGKLLPEEQYEIEKWLSEEGMESDAVEGLKTLTVNDTKTSIKKLNTGLNRALHTKKRRKRQAKPDQTILIAIAVILLLSVVAYITIKLAAHK